MNELWRDRLIAGARIVFGFLYACHGAQHLFGVFGAAPSRLLAWPSWWAALFEFAGGVLVLLGFATRIAAVLSAGVMAYAYFTVHQPAGLLPLTNHGEPAALFSWAFVLIAAIGPGAWCLDRLRTTAVARTPVTVAD